MAALFLPPNFVPTVLAVWLAGVASGLPSEASQTLRTP